MDEANCKSPLWSKEESGLYVDIFSSAFHGINVDGVQSEIDGLFNDRKQKDNVKSKQFRMEGNELFSQGKYHLALEKYNRSVCYAENDTDVIAVAYSNRSMCYLKIKLFKECLIDIEMIKRSTNYPSYLNDKLDSRKAECLRVLSNENDVIDGSNARIDNQKVVLSFDEHPQFDGIADCLEVQRTIDWGLHVTTTRNLKINETVMVEDPFSFVGHDCNDLKYYRCSHCYKSMMNFIPCKECVNSMFCNDRCLDASCGSRHKFECQLAKRESSDCECNEKQFQSVLDILWKLNVAFDRVDELIETVESIIHDTNDALFIAEARTHTTVKKLEMILRLETNKHDTSSDDFQRLIRSSLRNYFVIMRMPQFHAKFLAEKHNRFLKHLILHLVHTARQATLFSDLNVDVNIFREADVRDYGIGLYPIGSVLNHSCVPNVYCYSVDNRLICKVIRPIQSGEQLFRSYICGQIVIDDDENDPTIRQSYDFLKAEYKIENCKCSSFCPGQRNAQTDPWMETKDPNYQKIYSILTDKIENFFRMSDEERQSHVDNAIAYLNKYERVHPTHEIFVVQMFLQNYWMITTAQRD